jgi:hypothetical protein
MVWSINAKEEVSGIEGAAECRIEAMTVFGHRISIELLKKLVLVGG